VPPPAPREILIPRPMRVPPPNSMGAQPLSEPCFMGCIIPHISI